MHPRAVLALCLLVLLPAHAAPRRQDTGFLNRTIDINGVLHRYVVYVPENWSPNQLWPVILFLHGSGERGSEGMDETQIGLPQAIRLHPERWPFVVVMPQVPFNHHHWTDSDMMAMAIGALNDEVKEFHGDPDRTYLTGLSLGGYGAWELAKNYPRHWAAIAISSSGIFWSYSPDRWREQSTLPAEYAHAVGRTPIWLFHGSEDSTVVPRQSEIMFDAVKAENGHIRLWEYQGLHHDCWTRAFNEPELPRWLLSHRLNAQGLPMHDHPNSPEPQFPPFAEHLVVPLHPVALKVPVTILDTYVGEYYDLYNVPVATIQRQGEQVFLKNAQGDVNEIMAESTSTFFYPSGSLTRLTFEHDSQGRVTGILFRDDRHEEMWEKKK